MVTCPHCGEQHTDEAKFCSSTGLPMSPPTATERVRPLGDQKGVFDLLRDAVAMFRASPRILLITAAVLFVPGAFLSACTRSAVFGPAVILYGAVLPLTQGALTVAAADRMVGGQAGWREHWTLLQRRSGPLLSAMIPLWVLVMMGYSLYVLPGIILSFLFAFVVPVVVIEGTGGLGALKRSYELVTTDYLRTALMLLVFGLLLALAHRLAGLFVPSSAPYVATFLGDLLFVLVMPVPILGSVLLYFDLRRKLDGFTDESLKAELQALRG
jgi:hypothetical protein